MLPSPPELSDAVMPSILYLAETIAHSDECIPSLGRLERAMKMAGVTNLDCVSSDLRRLGTALAMVGLSRRRSLLQHQIPASRECLRQFN